MHSKTFASAAICLVILISSTSLVVGSEDSLPGESLYYVKTKVSEPIQRVLKTESGVSSIDFETSLIEKRLLEAEQLDQKGTLDAPAKIQLKNEITKQEKRVENAVNTFITKNTTQNKEQNTDIENDDPANNASGQTQISAPALPPQASDTEDSKQDNTFRAQTMMLKASATDKKTDQKSRATTTASKASNAPNADSKSSKSFNLNLKNKSAIRQNVPKEVPKEIHSAIKRIDEIVKKHQKVLEKIEN